MARVAINGFGRIGRCFFRAVHAREGCGVEIVAVNDLGSPENLAYLLKYDTVYGRAPFSVAVEHGALVVDGKKIALSREKDPAKLPWAAHNIDIVIESTGFFTDPDKALAHLTAGAKRVVISAPVKGDAPTILMGVNEEKLKTCAISSNASCTTNAASPLIGILDEAIGIERAILNTTHAYTATESIVDAASKDDDFRRGRAGAQNLIPESTGAAHATTKAHTQLEKKFDGIAIRVPVISGSLVDVTFVSKRPTTVDEVNGALRTAAKSDRWKDIFATVEEPIVSSDVIGQPYGGIADLALTRVVDGTLVKVLAWYDNEMGYAYTLLAHVLAAGKQI